MSNKPKIRVRKKAAPTESESSKRFQHRKRTTQTDPTSTKSNATERSDETPASTLVDPVDLSAFEDESFDFSMDDIFQSTTTKKYRVGDVVEGVVCGLQPDALFVDIQAKSEASLPVENPSEFSLGDIVKAKIIRMDGRGILLAQKIGKSADLSAYELAYSEGLPVEGTVLSSNKGGFSIGFGAVNGFCPISQITLGVVTPEEHVGQTYPFLITELKSDELIVSRRKLLEREREAQKEQRLAELSVGMNLMGTISNITAHGAFVDIGGVDGLIPRFLFSDIAEDLSAGDEIQVQIKSIKDGKISLSAPSSNPWLRMGTEFRRGGTYSATVTKERDFGFFIKLAANLEGLLHSNKLSSEDKEKLSIGANVDVRIQDFDIERKRIELDLSHGESDFANEPTKTLGDTFGDVFAQFDFDDNPEPKKKRIRKKKR